MSWGLLCSEPFCSPGERWTEMPGSQEHPALSRVEPSWERPPTRKDIQVIGVRGRNGSAEADSPQIWSKPVGRGHPTLKDQGLRQCHQQPLRPGCPGRRQSCWHIPIEVKNSACTQPRTPSQATSNVVPGVSWSQRAVSARHSVTVIRSTMVRGEDTYSCAHIQRH